MAKKIKTPNTFQFSLLNLFKGKIFRDERGSYHLIYGFYYTDQKLEVKTKLYSPYGSLIVLPGVSLRSISEMREISRAEINDNPILLRDCDLRKEINKKNRTE
jgi:hypothetical protein